LTDESNTWTIVAANGEGDSVELHEAKDSRLEHLRRQAVHDLVGAHAKADDYEAADRRRGAGEPRSHPRGRRTPRPLRSRDHAQGREPGLMDVALSNALIDRDWEDFTTQVGRLKLGWPERDGTRIDVVVTPHPARPSSSAQHCSADDYDAIAPVLDFADLADPGAPRRVHWPNIEGAPYNSVTYDGRYLPILCVVGTRGYHIHSSHSAEQHPEKQLASAGGGEPAALVSAHGPSCRPRCVMDVFRIDATLPVRLRDPRRRCGSRLGRVSSRRRRRCFAQKRRLPRGLDALGRTAA